MKWKPYITTLVACALVMLITIQPHAGFMLYFVSIPLAIWVMWSIVFVFRKPEQLKPRAINFGLWMTMIFVVLGVHRHYYVDARRTADNYAHAIEQYKTRHGAYPADLKTAGLDTELARQMMLGYVVENGKPALFYATTFEVFTTYFYDFGRRYWKYQPD